MANFAKVQNGLVVKVIVVEPEFFDTFVDDSPGEWIQTSYNTRGGIHYQSNMEPSEDQTKALRKNFASLGFTYDKTRDAFIPPKPWASWSLNEETCLWQAPKPHPSDGKFYVWDEDSLDWILDPNIYID